MEISKKLALILMCVLGMQFAAQGYDAVGLKAEVTQILDFIRECYKHNTQEAKKVAELLEKSIAGEYNSSLHNSDVIAIARALTAHTTIDAKLTVINQIMTEKAVRKAEQEKEWAEQDLKCAKDNARYAEKNLNKKIKEEVRWNENVRNVGMVLGIIAMLAAGFIYDHNFMVRFTDMMAQKLGDEWEKRENKKKNIKKA